MLITITMTRVFTNEGHPIHSTSDLASHYFQWKWKEATHNYLQYNVQVLQDIFTDFLLSYPGASYTIQSGCVRLIKKNPEMSHPHN